MSLACATPNMSLERQCRFCFFIGYLVCAHQLGLCFSATISHCVMSLVLFSDMSLVLFSDHVACRSFRFRHWCAASEHRLAQSIAEATPTSGISVYSGELARTMATDSASWSSNVSVCSTPPPPARSSQKSSRVPCRASTQARGSILQMLMNKHNSDEFSAKGDMAVLAADTSDESGDDALASSAEHANDSFKALLDTCSEISEACACEQAAIVRDTSGKGEGKAAAEAKAKAESKPKAKAKAKAKPKAAAKTKAQAKAEANAEARAKAKAKAAKPTGKRESPKSKSTQNKKAHIAQKSEPMAPILVSESPPRAAPALSIGLRGATPPLESPQEEIPTASSIGLLGAPRHWLRSCGATGACSWSKLTG